MLVFVLGAALFQNHWMGQNATGLREVKLPRSVLPHDMCLITSLFYICFVITSYIQSASNDKVIILVMSNYVKTCSD